jgi:PAS domain S-box-containing protein
VEDESVVSLDLAATIEKLGYAVAGVTARGQEAVRLAAEKQPSLVLMDINLKGDLDGARTAQQLQEDLLIPVVYLTAYSDEATLKHARVTHPFGYLLKPFDERELEVAIEIALYRHGMESALRDNEQRLQAILGGIQEAVVATGPDDRVTFINRAAETLLGCSAREARLRRRQDLFECSDPVEGIRRLAARTVVKGESVPVELSQTPVLDPLGRPIGQVTVLRDITLRLRAQAERERAVVERAARAAVEKAHRRAKLLADVSLSLAQSFEQPAEVRLRRVAERIVPELADWCFIDGVAPDDEHRMVRLATAFPVATSADRLARSRRPPEVSPEEWPGPARLVRRARPAPDRATDNAATGDTGDVLGQLLHDLDADTLISCPLVARGRRLGTITVVRVDPDRPFTEEDLEYICQLAERCAISLDSGRLYLEAQEAIRVRDEFLSIASHELKTPLTPLQLQIHTLEKRTSELGCDEYRRAWLEKRLATIRRQGDRLSRLVGELLEISRIMGGQLHLQLERVDLSEVTRKVLAGFSDRPDLPTSELRVDVAAGIVGRWDRVRLEQVVSNLLSNALKYGEGEPVSIEARVTGDDARLTVEDRGIGIAPEDQERVFGRFERAVSSRHYGGFGLGLYITKQLVEAMGGMISVQSEPNKGSTFTVSLPLQGPPPSPPLWRRKRRATAGHHPIS